MVSRREKHLGRRQGKRQAYLSVAYFIRFPNFLRLPAQEANQVTITPLALLPLC
jgi:hypothetical protein